MFAMKVYAEKEAIGCDAQRHKTTFNKFCV